MTFIHPLACFHPLHPLLPPSLYTTAFKWATEACTKDKFACNDLVTKGVFRVSFSSFHLNVEPGQRYITLIDTENDDIICRSLAHLLVPKKQDKHNFTVIEKKQLTFCGFFFLKCNEVSCTCLLMHCYTLPEEVIVRYCHIYHNEKAPFLE